MIISVLEGLDVLDVAMSLVSAYRGKNDRLKKMLIRAEGACDTIEGKELLRQIRLKITQMEDQWDAEV